MTHGRVHILSGNTFVVSDAQGDVHASATDPSGLFSLDTRFLSRWVLTVEGAELRTLSTDDRHHFRSRFFLAPHSGSELVDAQTTIVRDRVVSDGFREELTVLNHAAEGVSLTLRIDVAADFADLFEVKEARAKVGATSVAVDGQQLVLAYDRQSFHRTTTVTSSEPCLIDERGLRFTVRVEPHGSWSTRLDVRVASTGRQGRPLRAWTHTERPQEETADQLEQWVADAPRLGCDWAPLETTYRRSLLDLAALRFSPLVLSTQSLPAAGLPWFMTLFGRDSILTSLQALPFKPGLAATTLRVLGAWQGNRVDDFRDEDPGRILHEVRYGEMTAFQERPHSPYYGSVDATPLFVVLLDEYERWTGDTQLVRDLEMEARAALHWIDTYADLQGRGYVAYQRRNQTTGLENQCWKDSWDAISYRDGRLPGFPRATCEVQGYAYDAKVRGARLARQFWGDPAYAAELTRQAANLKARFNQDFWVDDGDYYALALDADGAQVDALTSNIGHLLWSGIVEDERAPAIAGHLLGPRLWSGWGVRTLAEGEARYNPIGYHNGTVWPFDNSFIAWGLRRYGFDTEAAQVAAGMLDAAELHGGRLPEAFGGYGRATTGYPVEYPTACSPQAWSTGAPLLALRTLLGLEPVGARLTADPAPPSHLGLVELRGIPGRWGRADVAGRGRVPVDRGTGPPGSTVS